MFVYEALELALFMISACGFSVLLFAPGAMLIDLPSVVLRRLLMGLAMGITAILIIHSPMGKRSGAHFNPAITLTYWRLGKIASWDAVFYILWQFAGGIFGVGLSALVFPKSLAQPPVLFAVTVPGVGGVPRAFAAEFFMAAVLMGVVLLATNHRKLAPFTSYFVGGLITLYILVLSPVSGFSINPARTVGSACFAHVWTAGWIYFAAPVAGMLSAAEIYLRVRGRHRIRHASVHPDPIPLER